MVMLYISLASNAVVSVGHYINESDFMIKPTNIGTFHGKVTRTFTRIALLWSFHTVIEAPIMVVHITYVVAYIYFCKVTDIIFAIAIAMQFSSAVSEASVNVLSYLRNTGSLITTSDCPSRT